VQSRATQSLDGFPQENPDAEKLKGYSRRRTALRNRNSETPEKPGGKTKRGNTGE
jgi:hypothetical protein